MKIHVLVYDQFANFEVMLVGWMKSNNVELETVSLEQDYVTNVEGFKVLADKRLAEVNPNEVELLLIPGGNTPSILGNENLKQFIKEVNANGNVIGAICYGPTLLGEAGILENKQFTTSVGSDEELFAIFKGGQFTNDDVTVDGNIITAKGNAYVEFALEVCKKMELVKPEHLEFYGKFLKNVKEPVNS
ncbi:DJ-1/PfpI family protein [Cytobacillus sp. FJAT-54145]|uniref:DJ-1/PfpI family protein n=1 Tax=Cytobacillus spartinae TaxID=3299023 RepID=A0ABW6KEI9_9BACI